jgi:membrane protease YdiL (CAAX protease family)
MVMYTFIFAASAGFFTCCWPGKRPARRIFLLAVLPAFAGLCALCARYLSLLASASSPRSVLQRGPAFEHGPVWMISKLLNLGAAFHFCIVGLVLTVAFSLLLARRKTSLPISVAHQNAVVAEATDAWRGCKRLIWIFQGAPLLILIPLCLIFLLLLLIPAGPAVPWRYQASQALTPTAEGLVFFAIAVWAMGKDNWKYIRQQIQLPTPSYAGLGLAIPAGAALLPSLVFYAFNRADWAAHSFGKLDPPLFGDYFGVPQVWMLTLFLGAFAEEVIFRGVLQRHFIERFRLWRGISFVAIIWAAFHFYGDSYSWFSDLEIVTALLSRVLFCLILGFVLAWLTLRSKSLIPATLAHGMNNVFAYCKPEKSFPGGHWVYLGLLTLLAYVLFRYWPVESSIETEHEVSEPAPSPAD